MKVPTISGHNSEQLRKDGVLCSDLGNDFHHQTNPGFPSFSQ